MKIKSSDYPTFLKEFIARFNQDKVPQVGAQLAYYLLMSLFPLVIFILSLLSFTSLGQANSLERLLSAMPRDTAQLLYPILLDLVSNRSGSILGLSLVLALWSGSSGINNLINAMDVAYDIENARKKLLRRIISVGYTILLAIVIVVTLAAQVFGDQLIQTIVSNAPSLAFLSQLWLVFQYILPLLVIILSLAMLYKWGPGFPQNKFITSGEALLGASLAGVLWTIASAGFGFYVSQFGNYSKTYGSLGGVIVLMLWLYLSSVIIMAGAEFIATYISRTKGGLDRQVIQTIVENPGEAAEAGTMMTQPETTKIVPVGYPQKPKPRPVYQQVGFYLGTTVGLVVGWFMKKLFHD